MDFGLIRLGESATREITLTNLAQVITTWSIQDVSENNSEDAMVGQTGWGLQGLLYKGKYSTPFYFHPFRHKCQRENLRLSEFKCLILTVFKHNCV